MTMAAADGVANPGIATALWIAATAKFRRVRFLASLASRLPSGDLFNRP